MNPTEPQAWVKLPSDEEMEEAKTDGSLNSYDFGYIGGMSRLLSAHHRIQAKFRPLFREVMFEPGNLSRREREMIAAVAAAAQDCTY